MILCGYVSIQDSGLWLPVPRPVYSIPAAIEHAASTALVCHARLESQKPSLLHSSFPNLHKNYNLYEIKNLKDGDGGQVRVLIVIFAIPQLLVDLNWSPRHFGVRSSLSHSLCTNVFCLYWYLNSLPIRGQKEERKRKIDVDKRDDFVNEISFCLRILRSLHPYLPMSLPPTKRISVTIICLSVPHHGLTVSTHFPTVVYLCGPIASQNLSVDIFDHMPTNWAQRKPHASYFRVLGLHVTSTQVDSLIRREAVVGTLVQAINEDVKPIIGGPVPVGWLRPQSWEMLCM